MLILPFGTSFFTRVMYAGRRVSLPGPTTRRVTSLTKTPNKYRFHSSPGSGTDGETDGRTLGTPLL